MKKFIALLLALMLVISLAGCGAEQPAKEEPKEQPKKEESAGKYKDGIYFAQEDQFSEKTGWKYVVTLEVKDGKIVTADWTAAHKTGGPDKKTLSKNGKYGLVEKGGAQAPWYEQAAKAEAYLVEKQDPTAVTVDEEGNTDDIAGVTIGVGDFFELAKKALDNGPVGKGKYEDGAYYAQAEGYDHGFKYNVSMTVINGNIVAADWNGIALEGGKDKETLSKDGEYGLVEKGGAQAPWYEQAAKAEAFLLEKQDPTAVTLDEEGATDDIAGVTIGVGDFFELVEKALDNGPIPAGQYKDGVYYAEMPEFSHGWKYNVNVVVKNGTIVGVDWTGLPEEGDEDKDAFSKAGKYGLVEKGGAQAPWYEQATKAEAYLLEKQDPTAVTLDDEGATDDIAGVTIGVGEFFELVEKALADAK